jgi:hypothetical protein
MGVIPQTRKARILKAFLFETAMKKRGIRRENKPGKAAGHESLLIENLFCREREPESVNFSIVSSSLPLARGPCSSGTIRLALYKWVFAWGVLACGLPLFHASQAQAKNIRHQFLCLFFLLAEWRELTSSRN